MARNEDTPTPTADDVVAEILAPWGEVWTFKSEPQPASRIVTYEEVPVGTRYLSLRYAIPGKSK